MNRAAAYRASWIILPPAVAAMVPVATTAAFAVRLGPASTPWMMPMVSCPPELDPGGGGG